MIMIVIVVQLCKELIKLLYKFERNESTTEVIKHMHHRNVCAAENIASVRGNMAVNLNLLIVQDSM